MSAQRNAVAAARSRRRAQLIAGCACLLLALLYWFGLSRVARSAAALRLATPKAQAATTALATAAPASAPPAAAVPAPARPLPSIDYRSIHAASGDYAYTSLCELVARLTPGGSAGVYRVASLTGKSEALDDSRAIGGFTYVQLELIAGLTRDTPARPVARIIGGPVSDLGTAAWDVSLEVGEVIGALLQPSRLHSAYFELGALDVFHQTDGYFENGQLRVAGRLRSGFVANLLRARAKPCANAEAALAAQMSSEERLHAIERAPVLSDGVEYRAELTAEAGPSADEVPAE